MRRAKERMMQVTLSIVVPVHLEYDFENDEYTDDEYQVGVLDVQEYIKEAVLAYGGQYHPSDWRRNIETVIVQKPKVKL